MGSIIPRTAGFNHVNIGDMLLPTTLMTIVLMWIGASPASTGGGIKTTTVTVAIANIFSLMKGKPINLFGREVSQLSINRAFAVINLSIFVIGVSSFVMMIEPTAGLLNIFFEVVSAYGTVGLSRGITGGLTDASKITLIVTMFLGRVTMFTFLTAFFKRASRVHSRYPSEDILIN